jgi:hypothetical protein
LIILEFIFDIVAYNLGYFFLKLVTLGKYPKKYLEEHSIVVELTGLFLCALILASLAIIIL